MQISQNLRTRHPTRQQNKHNLLPLYFTKTATGIAVLLLLCCGLSGVRGGNNISENDIGQDGLLNRKSEASEQTQEDIVTPASPKCVCQSDIHAVLRDLSAGMAEQGAELRNTMIELERLRTKFEGNDNLITSKKYLGDLHTFFKGYCKSAAKFIQLICLSL